MVDVGVARRYGKIAESRTAKPEYLMASRPVSLSKWFKIALNDEFLL